MLVEIARGELMVEKFRQRLAQLEEAYVCFQRIQRSDWVTPEGLLAFLNENRVYDVEIEELAYIVSYFDSTGTGRLNFPE